MISDLIAVELAHVNTCHPDFIGGKQAVSIAQQSRQKAQQQAGASAVPQTPPTANNSSNVVPFASADNPSNGATVVIPQDSSSKKVTAASTQAPIPASVGPSYQQQQGGGFLGLFRPAAERQSNGKVT